jgi:hypothetical protein
MEVHDMSDYIVKHLLTVFTCVPLNYHTNSLFDIILTLCYNNQNNQCVHRTCFVLCA